jgi:hypothetical protein
MCSFIFANRSSESNCYQYAKNVYGGVSELKKFKLAEYLAEVVAEKFCKESANCTQVSNWYTYF